MGMPRATISNNVRKGCKPQRHNDPEMEIESLMTEIEALETQLKKVMNESREPAEPQKKEAERQKKEAEGQKKEAEQQKKEANRQKKEAERQKEEMLNPGFKFANLSELLKAGYESIAVADEWIAMLRKDSAASEERLAIRQKNVKYRYLWELTSDLESLMKEHVLDVLPKACRDDYHYETGSRKEEKIRLMHYLNEIRADQELRKKFVKAYFYDNQIQFSEFSNTMETVKELADKTSWGTLLPCANEDITLAVMEYMIDEADLEPIHKERLKAYAIWVYP